MIHFRSTFNRPIQVKLTVKADYSHRGLGGRGSDYDSDGPGSNPQDNGFFFCSNPMPGALRCTQPRTKFSTSVPLGFPGQIGRERRSSVGLSSEHTTSVRGVG